MKSAFGSGFDWSLETPDKRLIMGMKLMGSINGTKIYLGVSTKNREVKFHREQLLKEIYYKGFCVCGSVPS